MRHQYTPIFRDLLTSSLWATATPATKVVWITLLLDADPEGYVPTSIPGLAQRAGVTLAEVEIALTILEGADTYSRTQAHEGRRIAAVDHGYHVLNFVSWRARAVAEAEKARKRNWAHQHRTQSADEPANDNGDVAACSGSSETLDAPKPKPKPAASKKKQQQSAAAPPVGADAQTLGAVYRSLDGWTPSDELRTDAQLMGITDFDERVAKLRAKPIGGQSGVLDRDAYIRSLFPDWKRWAETERAKAQRDAEKGAPRGFARDPGAPEAPERKRVQGAPAWVYEEHARFAKNNGLDLGRAARAFARQATVNPSAMKPSDVFRPFLQFLENLARAKQAVA